MSHAISGSIENIPDLGIVIPAFREESRISESLNLISEWISNSPLSVEVKVIVEKSPDNTLGVARGTVDRLGRNGVIEIVDNLVQRGKGYAVRSGMARTRARVKMFMDADLSVPLKEVGRAMARMSSEGAPDMLIGTRYDGGTIKKKQSLVRRFGSRGYNLILRCLGLTGVSDTQCGFKFFQAAAADVIFPRATVDGFGFDIELLMLAGTSDLRVDQIPVEWYNSSDSKFDPLSDGPRVLLDALKTRIRLGMR